MVCRCIAAFILMGVMLVFTSCSAAFQFNTEELLRPPKLTEDQNEIYTALQEAAGSSSIKLKYPKSGDYRSAFVFQNLDEDPEEEALVFYQLDSSQSSMTWMTLLDNTEDGWVPRFDLAGEGTDIDFVTFEHLSSPGRSEILIGWNSLNSSDYTLSVYSYEAGQLHTLFSDYYNRMITFDRNGDGISELVLVGRTNGSRSKTVRLVKGTRDGRVESVSSAPLASSSVNVAQVTYGSIGAGGTAIYIDEYVDDLNLATEVLLLMDDVLVGVVDGFSNDLYDQTIRPLAVYSQDINHDGRIEVPFVSLLPGYTESQEEEKLYLTEYRQLVDEQFEPVLSAAVNISHSYMVVFPERWIGQVTITKLSDSGEWRFLKYDESLESGSTELLRIRVYSQRDYQDKFEAERYKLVAKRGLYEYYAFIPQPADEPLAISEEEFQGMFSLL